MPPKAAANGPVSKDAGPPNQTYALPALPVKTVLTLTDSTSRT